MKKIVLMGLLSLDGTSLIAMKLPTVSEIRRLMVEDEKVDEMVEVFKKNRIDIDTCKCAAGSTYTDLFTTLKTNHAYFLAKNVNRMFAELEPHRSNPPGAHELRMLVSGVGSTDLDPVKIESFLANKRLNIDLISYGGTSALTIGEMLDSARHRDDVKAVLRLERIREFRYEDDSLILLNELIDEVLDGTSKFAVFQKHYSDMVTRKKPVDVDVLKTGILSSQTIGEKIDGWLGRLNKEAFLIAACVQANRTDKMATVRPLFKIFELDSKQVGPLAAWFKKFPVDIDLVPYDVNVPAGEKLGNKLDKLVARNVTEALTVAELMNAHRFRVQAEIAKALANYRSSKTAVNLECIAECFKKSPFDIDSASNLGAMIDRLNDYSLSAIFYEKRSKKTPLPTKPQRTEPDPKPLKESYVTPRNAAIALLTLGISCYIWYRRTHNTLQEDKEVGPVVS